MWFVLGIQLSTPYKGEKTTTAAAAAAADNNNNNNNNNLAKDEYLMRHDKVCTHLHYSICKALCFETTDKWYTHMPKPVCEKGDVTVLWNQAVHTDREVTANRPDIIIKNKKGKTSTLIDVAIAADRNVVQKEAENKLKYNSLCIEIQRIPVIIEATGIVMRSLRKNLEAVLGKYSIDSLQNTVILRTSHIIRKGLQCET